MEELGSITKDSKEIAKLLSEMQEFMPKQEAYLGKLSHTHTHVFVHCRRQTHKKVPNNDGISSFYFILFFAPLSI